MDIDCGGAPLRLLAQRAALLPDRGMLLVADAHLGKAQSFRRLGVPVPHGTTDDALARLDALLAATGARTLVFLGDLLHAARGRAPAVETAVRRWRERHALLELVLVRGNHDHHAGDPPADWGVRCVDGPWHVGPWALAHHPRPVSGAYVLAGHVHPAAALTGSAHQRLRLPCFHLGTGVGVLPAFGGFTGQHVVRPAPGDRLFVVDGERVHALPSTVSLAPPPLTTLAR
ncbi:MAG: ligase-associated DNA damage response endonuclease PdeM [Rubrivivax sp.]